MQGGQCPPLAQSHRHATDNSTMITWHAPVADQVKRQAPGPQTVNRKLAAPCQQPCQ